MEWLIFAIGFLVGIVVTMLGQRAEYRDRLAKLEWWAMSLENRKADKCDTVEGDEWKYN